MRPAGSLTGIVRGFIFAKETGFIFGNGFPLFFCRKTHFVTSILCILHSLSRIHLSIISIFFERKLQNVTVFVTRLCYTSITTGNPFRKRGGPILTRQELGEMHRTTTLCINHYENGVPSGTFHNPCMDGSRSFHGLTQLLTMMEDTLDSMSFPQSFTAVRSFAPPLAPHG